MICMLYEKFFILKASFVCSNMVLPLAKAEYVLLFAGCHVSCSIDDVPEIL